MGAKHLPRIFHFLHRLLRLWCKCYNTSEYGNPRSETYYGYYYCKWAYNELDKLSSNRQNLLEFLVVYHRQRGSACIVLSATTPQVHEIIVVVVAAAVMVDLYYATPLVALRWKNPEKKAE